MSFRAFIVDDEDLTRKGLRRHFDWSSYDIEIVGEAENGRDALDVIPSLGVDIVITDVRMPFMDGIALAKELRKRDEHIKIIFISGYDDVAYLKESLVIGAENYLLKAIDTDELKETIERIVRSLKQEAEQKQSLQSLQTALEHSLPLLNRKLFLTLIHDSFSSIDALTQRVNFYGVHLPLDAFYNIIIVHPVNYFQASIHLSEQDRQLLSTAAIRHCEQTLCKHAQGYVFEDKRGDFVFILHGVQPNKTEIVAQIANDIRSILSQALSLSVQISVCETPGKLHELKALYTSASNALHKATQTADEKTDTGEDERVRLRKDTSKILASLFEAADSEDMSRQLLQVWQMFRRCGLSPENTALQMFNELLNKLREFHLEDLQLFENTRQLWEKQLLSYSEQDLFEHIRSLYQEAYAAFQLRQNKRGRAVIKQVKQVIRQRFHTQISVEEIAKEVFLSTTYLCWLFKEETGMTINDYLIQVRIEEAKRLLGNPSIKLYHICSAVGYTAPSYFSRLFKRSTGYSPSEYRELICTEKALERQHE